ncbi:unnamed protein product [Lactuca virosa]|uniref:Uncharacterized protein n=1 Tax=Lactuca virosa TaxID=75947 RepID=A0AAU9PBI6_9ASTR|nr:unnamed protein product [Lactuca virosa]
MFIIILLLSTLFCTDGFLLFNGETNLLANRDGEKDLRNFAAVDTFLGVEIDFFTEVVLGGDINFFFSVTVLGGEIDLFFMVATPDLVGDTQIGGFLGFNGEANLVANLDGENDLRSFADVETFLGGVIAFFFALAVLGLVGDTESGGLRIFT